MSNLGQALLIPAFGSDASTQAVTNQIANPSFETDIVGWTASGTTAPTIAQDTAFPVRGTKSLKITWAVAATLAAIVGYTVTGLTNGAVYTWSVYVYVPAGNCDLRSLVATIGYGQVVSLKDQVYRMTQTFTANGTSQTIQVVNSGAATAGMIAYLDCAQVAQGAWAQPYTDGAQPGCVWLGTAHASKSLRAAT